MKSDEPDDRDPPASRPAPPDPRPPRATPTGALLGHLILRSAYRRHR
ncbi:hypothetical protein ACRS6B_02505 [Nocardia asteroides]